MARRRTGQVQAYSMSFVMFACGDLRQLSPAGRGETLAKVSVGGGKFRVPSPPFGGRCRRQRGVWDHRSLRSHPLRRERDPLCHFVTSSSAGRGESFAKVSVGGGRFRVPSPPIGGRCRRQRGGWDYPRSLPLPSAQARTGPPPPLRDIPPAEWGESKSGTRGPRQPEQVSSVPLPGLRRCRLRAGSRPARPDPDARLVGRS